MRKRAALVWVTTCALGTAMTAAAVVGLDDVVLAYLFEEGGAMEAVDSSPAANDGELTEGADWGKGRFGEGGLRLNVPEHVEVPITDSLRLTDTDFTMALWANFSEPPPTTGLIGHDAGLGAGSKKADWQYWGGRFQVQINRGGNDVAWARSGFWEDPLVDHWYHLAVTRTGDLYRFWVDGEQIGEDEEDLEFPSDGLDQPIRIGSTESDSYAFTGLMDEVLVARTAFSQDDLTKLVNGGIVGGLMAVEPHEKAATTWAGIKRRR